MRTRREVERCSPLSAIGCAGAHSHWLTVEHGREIRLSVHAAVSGAADDVVGF